MVSTFIKAIKEWISDTPFRIWGWVASMLAFLVSMLVVANWLSRNFPPWYVWLSGVIVLFSVTWFSFIPYYRRTKIKPVKVIVMSAYQSKSPSKKSNHINFDIEFSLKINTPSALVAKIQILSGAEFLEVNSPNTPIVQTNETESYVTNVDIDYFTFLDNIVANRDYILCVLVSGGKRISKEFNFGNASTILIDNKPKNFNLKINQ